MARYIVNTGDIIISIVGTIGLVARIHKELDNASLTENCVKLTNIDEQKTNSDFLYYYLISDIGQGEINKNTVGAVQKKLPIYGVENISITIPDQGILDLYKDISAPISQKISYNIEQIYTLLNLRDNLLPKLMREETNLDFFKNK